MTNDFFPIVSRWELPADVIPTSYREMASDGRLDREGITMWGGTRHADQMARVEAVVLLRGRGIERNRHFIRISSDLMNEVTDVLDNHNLSLIGQIHAHPPSSSTSLSPTDIQYGIAVPYYLSVVAPRYASSARPDLEECSAHVYEPSSGWRRFEGWEAKERLRISSQSQTRVITIGGEG
jgi:hypothetical protein